jgi:hypothetical protein
MEAAHAVGRGRAYRPGSMISQEKLGCVVREMRREARARTLHLRRLSAIVHPRFCQQLRPLQRYTPTEAELLAV